ncbi:MAG: glycoside hydrolase family 88 protein [Lachnospiraceae bacterium]|jgi:rhamnogalacturonyl hydrolase YesR|nr:glycoside hydrolase family 88 protein [Lachnospiraceae bacterium]
MEDKLNQKARELAEEAIRGLKGYRRYGFLKRKFKRLAGEEATPRDRINWPTALLANGLMAHYQNSLYSEMSLVIKRALTKYYKRFIFSRQKIYCLDDVVSGLALIDIYQITNDERFRIVLGRMVGYLKEHHVDESGSLIYRPYRDQDIYVESVGMICPFLCKYGYTYDDPGSISLATKQLVNFIDKGIDSRSGLPYHGYHDGSGLSKGIIGWGRACGWLLHGMIESLIYLDPENPDFDKIKQAYRHLVDKVEMYQHENGLFSWQLSAKDGPIDTSATAMILHAIARGIEHEFLIGIHRSRMLRGREALADAVVGGRIYDCLGECGTFGVYPQVYGSFPWSTGPALSLLSVNTKELPE